MGNKVCKTCGQPGDCGGDCDLCANCWEVEKRLADYVKSENGRRFIARTLNDAGRWRKFHRPGQPVFDGCSASIHTDHGLVKLTLEAAKDVPKLVLVNQPESARTLAESLLRYADAAEVSRGR